MGAGIGSRWRPSAFFREEGAQTVVIVALSFTVLLGFTALAFDVGRYYTERRTLQDAVDAAALACARAYGLGGTSDTARAAATDILENYNLKGSIGRLYTDYHVPAAGAETYYDNIVAPKSLKDGVLPQASPLGCRVAVYIDVPTTLLRVANPGLQTIALNARGYALAKGGLLPVVVPKYSNGPGPGNGDASQFIHHTMAQGQDYQCTVTSDSACTAASTSSKGREFVLFGASQRATNDNSFRGYIALDVRDFQTFVSGQLQHTSYNSVAANATINTLKDFEANWINEGYPGPDLCTVSTTTFLPCAETAVINGSSAGIFVEEMTDRFRIGDTILAQLYDGTVKTIPNFAIASPTLLVANSTQSLADQTVSYTFSSQYADSSAVVTTSFIPDDGTITGGTGDSLNPWNTGSATVGTFASNPTPNDLSTSYAQTWSGITTTNAPQGIYVVFLKGTSSAPYAGTEQLQIVTVNVADQKKQFYIDTSDTYVSTTAGTNATYTVRVTDGTGQSSWNGGNNSITLQIDSCPTSGGTTLTCYFGTTSPGSQTLTTSAGTNSTLTVEVPSGTTSGTVYSGWIRAYGPDFNGRRVSRVLQVRTAVSVTLGGTTDYVDVLGFAAFEITFIDSNDVRGRAVSGWTADPNDPALAIVKKYRLVPWETD